MVADHEAKVRELAYRLWEEDGRPEGRDVDYWLKAEHQLAQAGRPAAEPRKHRAAKPKASAEAAAPKAAGTPKAAEKPQPARAAEAKPAKAAETKPAKSGKPKAPARPRAAAGG